MAIGLQYMPRGFLAVGWQDAIKATGAKNPEQKMDALQRLMWDDVVSPLWSVRNDIMHRKENKHQEQEDRSLTEKISWYVKHRHDILSVHDQQLAEVDLSTLHRMTRQTKRAWARHLEVARNAFTKEAEQLARG